MRSVEVNQRPDAKSHHALSALVVKRSQLAFATANSPSATWVRFGCPLILTRHMGDVLTITSGVLPAGGGVVGTAAG